jgi:1-acyl-sn-glycerol-3-phosphate acyltransferase
MVQTWSKELLAILNVTLVLKGGQPALGLVVANHVSWLDILVMNASHPVRFLSKSDVKAWPLLGRLIEGSGTLFIERSKRRDALRVVQTITRYLRDGHRIAVFPEGTTNDGINVLPFHGNLIQAALDAPCPVTPVGIRYLDAVSGTRSMAPTYVDDDTLLSSVWRTLRQGRLLAEVSVGDPQLVVDRDRRQWAHDLREAVVRLTL